MRALAERILVREMRRADDKTPGLLLLLKHWQQLEMLTPEELRNVLQAVFAASGAECEMPELSRLERAVFYAVNGDVQRSRELYDERCKQRVEAGRKGGLISRPPQTKQKQTEANGSDAKQTEANGSDAKQMEANEHKNKDKVKDKDMSKNKDSILSYAHPPEEAARGDGSAEVCAADAAPVREGSSLAAVQKNLSAANVEAHFEALWQLWPNKRGKSAVKAGQRRRLAAVSVEEMKRAIARYEKEFEAAPADRQMLYGGTWFNGRYEDYLDAAYTPLPAKKHRSAAEAKPARGYEVQMRSSEEEARSRAYYASVEE